MKSYAFVDSKATSPVISGDRVAKRAEWFSAARGLLDTWTFRAHSRRELARLDAFQLADLGLDPVDAAHEATKPFWRA